MCLTIRAACGHWSLMDELLLLRQALYPSGSSAEIVQRRLPDGAGLPEAHRSSRAMAADGFEPPTKGL